MSEIAAVSDFPCLRRIRPARPAPADATRAIVEGSGTTVIKPVAGSNVAD